VECILTEDTSKEFIDCNIIELKRQNIHDAVAKYLKNQNKKSPQNLVKNVSNILWGGYQDWIGEVGAIYNCDLLILTTDSEKVLRSPEDYFSYGINLFNILSEAAIRFYGIVLAHGYPQDQIPLVLPIITFPSIEIIIAPAKGLKNYYGKKPLELKQMIYNIDKDRPIMDEEVEENAMNFITVKGIENIFNNIPESRQFIQTLSCYRVSCYL